MRSSVGSNVAITPLVGPVPDLRTVYAVDTSSRPPRWYSSTHDPAGMFAVTSVGCVTKASSMRPPRATVGAAPAGGCTVTVTSALAIFCPSLAVRRNP